MQDYNQPTVVQLLQFENGNQQVKSIGHKYFPILKAERVFNEDGKSWTFEADLKPNTRYQILISNNFRKENGVRLKPYLIDFKTGE